MDPELLVGAIGRSRLKLLGIDVKSQWLLGRFSFTR